MSDEPSRAQLEWRIEELESEHGDMNVHCVKLEKENERLRALVKQGKAVVDDFLPNIENCALQDYARLAEFMIAAAQETADE